MIKRTALPNVFTIMPVTESFECSNKFGNNGICRDRPPGRSTFRLQYLQKDMDMIGHDTVFVYRDIVIKCIHYLDLIICKFSVFC